MLTPSLTGGRLQAKFMNLSRVEFSHLQAEVIMTVPPRDMGTIHILNVQCPAWCTAVGARSELVTVLRDTGFQLNRSMGTQDNMLRCYVCSVIIPYFI